MLPEPHQSARLFRSATCPTTCTAFYQQRAALCGHEPAGVPARRADPQRADPRRSPARRKPPRVPWGRACSRRCCARAAVQADVGTAWRSATSRSHGSSARKRSASSKGGTVRRLAIRPVQQVEGADVLLEIGGSDKLSCAPGAPSHACSVVIMGLRSRKLWPGAPPPMITGAGAQGAARRAARSARSGMTRIVAGVAVGWRIHSPTPPAQRSRDPSEGGTT